MLESLQASANWADLKHPDCMVKQLNNMFYANLHKNIRITSIKDIAFWLVILGGLYSRPWASSQPWGGAFGGDPKEISELFSSAIAELGSGELSSSGDKTGGRGSEILPVL